MSSYLDIARTVLRAHRRPMSAKSILTAAYRAGVVPTYLFGKTQHKTLQARISEDILHHRETSAFYRTEPGQFALVEFLKDPCVPVKWKTRFPARRRIRDLKRENALAVKRSSVVSLRDSIVSFHEFLDQAESDGALASMHPDHMGDHGYCSIWTFSIVRKGDDVLAYRVGRYRDDRDAFANRQSIGFPGALAADDVTLFSKDRFGVADCAIAVLQQDLDLSLAAFEGEASRQPEIDSVMAVSGTDGRLDLVILLFWACPDWFEPTTRRLSLNNPRWLCFSSRHNDIDDFEPWSAQVLTRLTAETERTNFGNAKNNDPASCVSAVRTCK